MQHSQSTNMEKLSMVINRWKESQSSPFTWETVIATIEGPRVNNRMKANEIRDYLSKGNYYLILNPYVNDTVIVFSNVLVYIHNG